MNPSFAQRFFTAFAFVALAGILAFGGGIRYFCYCAGTAVMTFHEHCHGEHDHDDHDDHHHEDHEDHHHELVKTSTELRLPEVVSAPELKLIPLLWTALCEWETARPPDLVAERPRPEIAEDPPPLSHQVARTVVRLI